MQAGIRAEQTRISCRNTQHMAPAHAVANRARNITAKRFFLRKTRHQRARISDGHLIRQVKPKFLNALLIGFRQILERGCTSIGTTIVKMHIAHAVVHIWHRNGIPDGGDMTGEVKQLFTNTPDIHEKDDWCERSPGFRLDKEGAHFTIRCGHFQCFFAHIIFSIWPGQSHSFSSILPPKSQKP